MTMQTEWEQIKILYVRGRTDGDGLLERPTLQALANEHDIPISTVKARSSREGWAEERNLFYTELIQKSHQKALEELSGRISQLDVQAFIVARAMFGLAAQKLRDRQDTLTLGDQERLLRMCDLAHKLGRRALGQGEA